jgi:predicted MFS family arabinose efflux permease
MDARPEQKPNGVAVATVLANRLFYSINWFTIPPIFFLIALDLHTPVAGLGLIGSAFLIGIGAFQVPGAILSAKIGPRTTCIAGMALLSVSAIACAAVSSIDLIAFLRFFSGMGMALFFPPSISLMTSLSRKGQAGFVLGLNNATASLGGGIGLGLWAVVGDSMGWRLSLVLIGVLGLAAMAVLFLVVPKDRPSTDFSFGLPDLRKVLLDKWLLLVGGVLLSYNIGNTLDATFVAVYLHDVRGISATVAGAIGSLTILTGLFTAPLAGHFHNRVKRVKPVLALSGFAIAAAVALSALGTTLAVALSAVFVGLASGVGYTFAFGTAWHSGGGRHQKAIALSWVNCFQLFFSFWAPYLFSYMVEGYGYPLAWLTGGIYTAVFIFPVLLSKASPVLEAVDR